MLHSEIFHIVTYCLSMLCMGLCTSALPVLVTTISENTGLTLAVISSVIVLRPAATVLGSFLYPLFTRFLSIHKCMALGLVLGVISSYAYPATQSVAWVCIDLILSGFTISLIETGSNTQINRLTDKFARLGNFMQYACLSLGAILCPFIIRWGMRSGGDYQHYPFYIQMVGIPVAAALLFLPEPKGAVPQEDAAKETVKSGGGRFFGVAPLVWLSSFFILMASGGEVALSNWSPSIAVLDKIADQADAALLASAFAVGSMLFRLFLAFSGERAKMPVVFSAAITTVTLAVLGMMFSPYLKLNLFLQFCYGAGNGAILSSLLMLLRQSGKTDEASVGIVIGFANIGNMAISWPAGQVLDRFGGRACFGFITAVLAGAFVLHFFIRKMTAETIGGIREQTA